MIPIATALINGRPVTLEEKDGYYFYTFTADTQTVDIQHLGCIGETQITELQIEKNDHQTYYVPPDVTYHPMAEILREMTHVRLELTDPESDFRSSLLLTNQGLLTEFENGPTMSALKQSAASYERRFEGVEDGKTLVNYVQETKDGILSVLTSTTAKLVKSQEEEYYRSTSQTALTGGTWQTAIPSRTAGQSIWRRYRDVYADGTKSSWKPSVNGVNITGDKGDQGVQGVQGVQGTKGRGITAVVMEYGKSTSNTVPPTSWASTPPQANVYPIKEYVWERERITWDMAPTTTYTTPRLSEVGNLARDFRVVNDTVTAYERIMGGTDDQGRLTRLTQQLQTNAGFKQAVTDKISGLETRITTVAGGFAVQNLTDRDKILSELILTDKLFKANISASEDMSLYNNLIDNTANFNIALPPTTFMTPGIAYEATVKEPHDLYLAKGSATGTIFTIRFKLNATVYPHENPYLSIDWANLGSARFRLENGAYTAWLDSSVYPISMALPKPSSNASYLEMQFQGDGMLIKPRSFMLSAGGVKVPWRDSRDNKTYSTAGFNMTTDGIRLKGEVIELDGNVRFDEAFGNKLFVDGLKANHIESLMGVFGKIIATNIDAQYITTNMLTAIEGAFKSANSTLQLNGDRMLIDSLYSWDLLIDRRGLSITNAAGQRLGSFVGAIDKETRLDNGIAMIAERNFTASLGYRGSNLDNVFESALTVNGTTGDITLISGLKPHSSNPFKLELVGQSINLGKVYNSATRQMEDNIIRGVSWKCGNTRVAFMENGLVYVSTASGDMRAL